MSNGTILVVEDDAVAMTLLKSKLFAAGYEVIGAADGAAALEVAKAVHPDLMILDLGLIGEDPFTGNWDGFGVLQWLQRMLPEADFPVIIHTADKAPGLEARARAAGAYGVFKKWNELGQLLIAVRQALEERKLKSALLK